MFDAHTPAPVYRTISFYWFCSRNQKCRVLYQSHSIFFCAVILDGIKCKDRHELATIFLSNLLCGMYVLRLVDISLPASSRVHAPFSHKSSYTPFFLCMCKEASKAFSLPVLRHFKQWPSISFPIRNIANAILQLERARIDFLKSNND